MHVHGTWIPKTVLKKNKVGILTFLSLKMYYKVISNQGCITAVRIDIWNELEIPEVNPCIYGQLRFLARVPRSFSGGKIIFSKSGLYYLLSTCKIMNLDSSLAPYTRSNLKSIKDLNENTGIFYLHNLEFSDGLLDETQHKQ